MPRSRTGPVPHIVLNSAVQIEQAQRVFELHARGLGFRQIGRQVGLSTTTAWRRWWFLWDWFTPTFHGRPKGPLPPQRGTRACPSGGRPCLPTLDHPEMYPAPPVRCGARARTRDGELCRNWPIRGAKRCRMHGGATRVARANAAAYLQLVERRRQAAVEVHREHCKRGRRAVPEAVRW